MKEFLSNMNLPRGVFLFGVLASAVLGWLVYRDAQRLDQIHRDLRRVPGEVQEIQRLALQLKDLQEVAGTEGILRAQGDAELYIRRIAAMDKVAIGQVTITPSRGRGTTQKGIEDLRYKIEPTNRNTKFTRGQIGNFLYQLEAESRQVKVTSVKLDPFEKIKPGELNQADTWTFSAEVTNRKKEESEG